MGGAQQSLPYRYMTLCIRPVTKPSHASYVRTYIYAYLPCMPGFKTWMNLFYNMEFNINSMSKLWE